MKFPHTVRFCSLLVKIYGRSDAYPFYRLSIRVAGKRVLRSFQTFKEAKREAKTKLRQAAKGNVSAVLSVKESANAIAVREALEAYQQVTGWRLSAHEAVSSYISAAKLLSDNITLAEFHMNIRRMSFENDLQFKNSAHFGQVSDQPSLRAWLK